MSKVLPKQTLRLALVRLATQCVRLLASIIEHLP